MAACGCAGAGFVRLLEGEGFSWGSLGLRTATGSATASGSTAGSGGCTVGGSSMNLAVIGRSRSGTGSECITKWAMAHQLRDHKPSANGKVHGKRCQGVSYRAE
jgi:hypothetical protein